MTMEEVGRTPLFFPGQELPVRCGADAQMGNLSAAGSRPVFGGLRIWVLSRVIQEWGKVGVVLTEGFGGQYLEACTWVLLESESRVSLFSETPHRSG